MTHRNLLPAAALSLLFIGCTAGGPGGGDDLDPRRGPLGKADSHGTCQSACGGQSQDGSCWCDDQCEFYGDCCEDKHDVCEAEPQECGGLAGLTCDEGEYCHYEQGEMCGAADQLGTCQPEPEACIEVFAPVCGCDGVTYSNECYAHAAGTSVASEGACEGTGEQLCLTDDACDAGQICDHSECHSPPCPDGMACPQVCYGVCADESEPEPEPEPEPAADSCEGSCGGPAPAGCYCDELCTSYGDCCDDYQDVCAPDQGDDREPASGVCVKNSNDECQTDADCAAGGCGGELCFNPEISSGISTCECTTPANVGGCGCVDGQCTWWN